MNRKVVVVVKRTVAVSDVTIYNGNNAISAENQQERLEFGRIRIFSVWIC